MRAFFVEIGNIGPALNAPLSLRRGGDSVDVQHPLHVPVQVIAVELDFEMIESVVMNPFGQRFRQSIADRTGIVGSFNRIDGRNQVT